MDMENLHTQLIVTHILLSACILCFV